MRYDSSKSGGGSFGASYSRAQFESREDAVLDCIRRFIPSLQHRLDVLEKYTVEYDESGFEQKVDNREKIKIYKSAIYELNSRLNGYQLTLF